MTTTTRLRTVHRHRGENGRGSFTLCGQQCDGPKDLLCSLPQWWEQGLTSAQMWCGRCDAVLATQKRKNQPLPGKKKSDAR